MDKQEQLPFDSFVSMRDGLREIIRTKYNQPRSIHSRIKIVSTEDDLKILIRETAGTPNGITVAERDNSSSQAWRKTTLNLGLLSTQGEVQLTLPSDGMHPRPHKHIETIDQLPQDSAALLARGIELI